MVIGSTVRECYPSGSADVWHPAHFFYFYFIFTGLYLAGHPETVGIPCCNFPLLPHSRSHPNKPTFLSCPHSMSQNLYQMSPSPSPPPDINASLPHPSHGITTPPAPPIAHNLQTPIPVYQRNSANNLWMPYDHRIGALQHHASPMWSGGHPQSGWPGGYVTPSPFSSTLLKTELSFQNTAPNHEMSPGGGSSDPLYMELAASNRLMQKQIANLEQQLAETT